MRTQGIAFHFTNPQSSLVRAPPRGLVRPYLTSSRRATVHFVVCQVLETHEIQGTHKNGGVDLLPRNARIQNVVSLA